ncbi:MAG: radical SAM protein [Candidatus Bathyarchaeia archaeon]
MKDILYVSGPISGGLILSYKCTSRCRHCMYACSPKWDGDWISGKDMERVLTQLAGRIRGSPYGSGEVGINYGLHFTGGEPFLNFRLLLKAVEMADELGIPSTFVETNCFWCTDDEAARERLLELRKAGLNGILLSVNPFILEQVPFERAERASRIGREVFDGRVIMYQSFFYDQFKKLGIRGVLPFEEYLRRSPFGLHYAELLPMGRAVYQLGYLYEKAPAKYFFKESCREELTRGWHIHFDNYCNYIPGYCGGISLGDAREIDSLSQGVDLSDKPILDALSKRLGKLYELGLKEFNYEELSEGYVSKCHLCLDIRKHIAQQTGEFKELKPREFYYHLND